MPRPPEGGQFYFMGKCSALPAKKKTLQRCSFARQEDVAIGIAIEYNSFINLGIKAYAIGVVLRAKGMFMGRG